MKLSCDVIRDLIPLYAENMTSAESSALVEEHLKSCADCRNMLAQLRNLEPIPIDTDTIPVKQLRTHVRRKTVLSVMIAVCSVFLILCGFLAYCLVPVALSAEEAIISVKMRNDKPEKLELSERADLILSDVTLMLDNASQSVHCFYEYRCDLFKDTTNLKFVPVRRIEDGGSIWYCGVFAGEGDTLLWGSGEKKVVVSDNIIDATLLYMFHFALWTGLVAAVLGILLRKKKMGTVLWRLAIPLLCFTGCVWFVTGGQLIGFFGLQYILPKYTFVALMTVFSWVVANSATTLVLLNLDEKALSISKEGA